MAIVNCPSALGGLCHLLSIGGIGQLPSPANFFKHFAWLLSIQIQLRRKQTTTRTHQDGHPLPFTHIDTDIRRTGCGTDDNTPVTSHPDRKSTRLNSSHVRISYAVFCLKKKNNKLTSSPT